MSDGYLPPDIILWLCRIERLRWGSFKPLVLAAFHALAAINPLVVSQPETAQASFAPVDPLLRQVERFIFMVFYISERRAHTGKADIYRQAHRQSKDAVAGDRSSIPAALELATRFVGALNDNYDGDVRNHSLPEDDFHGWTGHFDLSYFRDTAKRGLDRDKGFYEWDFTRVVLFEYELSLQGATNRPKARRFVAGVCRRALGFQLCRLGYQVRGLPANGQGLSPA